MEHVYSQNDDLSCLIACLDRFLTTSGLSLSMGSISSV